MNTVSLKSVDDFADVMFQKARYVKHCFLMLLTTPYKFLAEQRQSFRMRCLMYYQLFLHFWTARAAIG